MVAFYYNALCIRCNQKIVDKIFKNRIIDIRPIYLKILKIFITGQGEDMGGFLNSLKNFFAMPEDSGSKFITFNIKCGKCGEEITVRASKTSDISRIYEGESAPAGAEYLLRKEVLGNGCNNLIYITVYFGAGYRVISKEISGGKFTE